MATNLDLDPDLVARVLVASGERTKKAAVTLALQEFLATKERMRIPDAFGTMAWDGDYDYKAERRRRSEKLTQWGEG
jgi:Arc/MetJ family transcription regulator